MRFDGIYPYIWNEVDVISFILDTGAPNDASIPFARASRVLALSSLIIHTTYSPYRI